MNILILILFILFPTLSHAEYLGCFEPNEAVEIKSLFMDSTGARVDPTIPGCEIFDPNDTTATTCTSGPTKIGTIVGWYESSHTIPASPLAGTWYAKVNGTISSVVNEGTDTFHVVDTAGDCASRTGVVTASGTVTSVTNGVTLASTATSPQLVDDIWDELLTGATHNVSNSAGKLLRLISSVTSIDGTVNDAAATTTYFISDLTSAVTDFYKDSVAVFTSGALTGQARPISAYNGTTKRITVDEAWTSAPANTVAFTIISTHVHPVTQISAAVWDELSTGHLDAGKAGQQLWTDVDAILLDTGTDGVVVASGSKSGYSLAADQSAVTIGTVNALGTQAKADVNAEADTALSDVNLDHLVGTATGIPAVVAGTYLDQVMDDGTAVYDRTTDSLQAIRDKGTDIETDTQDIQGRLPTALVSGRIDSNVGAMGTNVIGSAQIAADAITSSELASSAAKKIKDFSAKCDILAATSGVSFTIATCTDEDGTAITLSTDMFVGSYMVAYTNGAAQCNVVGQGVFVSDVTAGVVTVKETDMPGSGFSAIPDTTYCGVRIHP